MTKVTDAPGHVFAALADPTRAQIIDWLDEGGTTTATRFAARLPISRQAVSRHLKELESAGLVIGTKRGREVHYGLEPRSLVETARWLQVRADRWEQSLRRLAEHLDEDA